MAYIRCDVASNGLYEARFTGAFFPRVDVSPMGVWIRTDCNPDGSVFVETPVGRRELGAKQPNNPACPRFQSDGLFHVYMVALVNGAIVGRHFVFDDRGYYLDEWPNFDAIDGQAMGILDVTSSGEIRYWNTTPPYTFAGFPPDLYFLNWRERGDYVVGTFSHTWLGATVYEKPTGKFYRAWPFDTQLFPGVADNGTVSGQGEGGGFIPRATWLAAEFDPLDIPDPEPPDPEPPDPEPPDPPDPEPPDPEPPDPEPEPVPMQTRALISFDNCQSWIEVFEDVHQDASIGIGPIISVRRVSDGQALQADNNGTIGFTTNNPGADERWIATPGAYAGVRGNINVAVPKVGVWSQQN